MEKLFEYSAQELETRLCECAKNGVTELFVHDEALSRDKGRVLRFLRTAERDAPDLFISIKIDPRILDADVIRLCSGLNVSLELDFAAVAADVAARTPQLLFDKKFYSRRCASLNNAALVFGVRLFFADAAGDSLKAFCDRLNFTVQQYPNHIDFPQLETSDALQTARVSATFSGENLRLARDIAFSCRTFYSAGRAVPWFNSVLYPLKMPADKFFADFAEWQRVNNCDFKSGFVPEDEKHDNIEKMQLHFLQMKYEEKNAAPLFSAVRDIVRLNGAFSRVVSDGASVELETDYNPDDLLSPESMDIAHFFNDVCMERCLVSVFLTDEGPDYKIL